MRIKLFFPFDKVQYCGEKLRGELRGKLGIICAEVQGSKQSYVVDFGDASYIMDECLLEKYKSHSKEDLEKAESEIYRRRSRKSEDE